MATEDTPENVARAATVAAPLDLDAPMLLGVTGTEAAPAALLRLPGGQVEKVVTGAQVDGRTVVAIDGNRIALARNGRAEWIAIPGADTASGHAAAPGS